MSVDESLPGCPNPSSVDKALTFADRKAADGWVTARDLEMSLRVLSGEVRRLREDKSHRLSREDSIALKNELLAEVDKLRAADTRQMETLAAENERLQKVVADQALTIGTLKDELGKRPSADYVAAAESELKRLRQLAEGFEMERDHAQHLLSEERSLTAATVEHTTALERKVAELQENASATLYHEALRMKRELEWYARRDLCRLDQVKAYYGANIDETDVLEAIDALIEWEKTNPKPGATP